MANKTFTLVEGTFSPEELGPDMTWAGFHIHDDRGNFVSYADVEQFNLTIFRVAGVSMRADALQRSEFDPGEVLALVHEPTNAYDKNAVGVWDKARRTMIGYVPRELSEYMRAAITMPNTSALSLAEHRKSGKRVSLTVLFGPMGIK